MNYTAEDLKNTKIRIESPEHSKYVQELVFALGGDWGLGVNCVWNVNEPFIYIHDLGLTHGCMDDTFDKHPFKEIKIPMPEEKKEWPQVGDVVVYGYKSIRGEVKAISDGLAWIKNEYGSHVSKYLSDLSRPKTPEEELCDELIRDLSAMQRESNGYIASALVKKYNITKK